MQNEVVLYLENPDGDSYSIPIFEGYNVSLNFSFSDIENFKPTGTFSSTFRCPIDEDFQNFIGSIYDVNYVGWFNPKAKIPAYITANTLPFSQGHAQVMNIILTQTGWEVELTFYGETPDIRTALADNKLQDITDLSDLNHELTYDNITDDNLESGYVNYFLIDKGQNFSENGEGGTQSIFGDNFQNCLQPSDFTPAVKARWIWDKIWEDAGFAIESPSNLPDVLDNYWIPWFNGTVAPISNDAPNANLWQLRLDTANAINVTSSTTSTAITTFTEDFDIDNNVNASNVFTAPADGLYRIRYWLYLTSTGQGDQVNIIVKKNGSDFFQSGFVTINPNGSLVTLDSLFLLQAGDTLSPAYTIFVTGGDTVTINGTAGYDTQNGSGFECYEVAQQYSDYTVDMIRNAPDMRQIDFITSILKMHNAVVVPDRNIPNKLRVEAMNDYLQSGNTVDWTSKLDLSKDVQIKSTNSIQSRDLEFTYTKDGDALNKYYTESQDRTFGMIRTKDSGILTNLRSDFATGDKKVEIQFASTPCNPIPGTNIPIPKFVSEQGELFKAKPRILYHAFDAEDLQVWDEDTNTVTATDCRILSHFDDYDLANEEPGVGTLDLNFGAESFPSGYLQTTFGTPYQNLFYRYYQDYIREIYDSTARIMEAHFALNINDVLGFGFNNTIFIQDAYWRILEINGYGEGLDNTTKVKLIKILSLDSECEFTPSSANADGTIDFVDGSGATSAGSQECCERYGFTWNSSACYWNAPEARITPSTSGLRNFGAGVQNTQRLPSDSISFVSGSTIEAGNFGARFGGHNIESGTNNLGAIVQGRGLKLADDLGSVAAFGENADVEQSGIHFGGGYDDNDLTTTQGRAQFGDLVLFGSGDVEVATDSFELLFKGNDRLVIPDETTWSVTADIALQQYDAAGGSINFWLQQTYIFQIHKANNVAAVTSAQIAPKYEDGSTTGQMQLGIDATTDTTEHRFSLVLNVSPGTGSKTLDATMRLKYTQVKE